ncbi:hypothetical protein FA95DRAFT_1552757 [Auriscalpium vulgare]|uniref:Uncharacterized protein n=1 Tax=Auriscalpium vulgare TaxID=40419 RepID=A0ACB8SBN6_9AGAM|nr:hypothetical protein FA95DRAFT_1552757 [Auriscalpium vulgare]
MTTAYEPVPNDEEGREAAYDSDPLKQTGSTTIVRIIRCSLTIVCVCAVLDVALVLRIASHRQPEIFCTEEPRRDWSTLEYISSYIGFDRLYPNNSIPPVLASRPIVNHALIFGRVWSNKPSKVFSYWQDLRLESHRMTYGPNIERRFLVDPETSTIAQFRAKDYGMERCALVLDIPAYNHTLDASTVSSSTGSSASIDVWALSVEEALQYHTLSWQTKPPRKAYVGSLAAAFGMRVELPAFECPRGSYQTFEYTCSDPACEVDVLSMNGVTYIVQSHAE